MTVLEQLPARLSAEDLAGIRPDAAELAQAIRSLHRKALGIAALVVSSYVGLLLVHSLWLAIPLGALLVVGLIATATGILHDANHGAFGGPRRLSKVLAYSADLLGASSWLWARKHNGLHHASPNVVGVDVDIDQMPFARLAPDQPWRPWYRYQHLYLWLLYGFMTVQWMLLADFSTLAANRIGAEPLRRERNRPAVLRLFAGKAVHLSWAVLLPLAFHRWWVVLAFYVSCSWLVGFVLAVVFQVAHCVDRVAFAPAGTPHTGPDFVAHQLATTADVALGATGGARLLSWLVGGLDHQIEHHLAPDVPHTAYAAMAARLRARCAAVGVTYHLHGSPAEALRSHARWLRAMGRPASQTLRPAAS